MNIYDQFESKYLRAADLQGRTVRAKIARIATEILGNDSKMIVYFDGKTKGMVCNRTNAMTLADAWGPETDNWVGGDLELMAMKVPFQGKLTDSLRVRPLQTRREAPPPRQPSPAPPPSSESDYGAQIDDSDIPF